MHFYKKMSSNPLMYLLLWCWLGITTICVVLVTASVIMNQFCYRDLSSINHDADDTTMTISYSYTSPSTSNDVPSTPPVSSGISFNYTNTTTSVCEIRQQQLQAPLLVVYHPPNTVTDVLIMQTQQLQQKDQQTQHQQDQQQIYVK